MLKAISLLGVCALLFLAVMKYRRHEVLLQQDLVSSYRSQGHAVSKGLLEASLATALAGKMESLFADYGRRAFSEGSGKEVRFTFAVHELDSFVADFVTDRNGSLWQEAARLAGTAQLCILMDRGFSKDPGDPETHWHRDDFAIGLPTAAPGLRTVHGWIPASAMRASMGTLRYLLGSHEESQGLMVDVVSALWGQDMANMLFATELQDDDLELGDVAWHDGRLVHSAGSNAEGAVRNGFAVSYAYCPADATGCNGAHAWLDPSAPFCHIAGQLFDAEWKQRHREGEEDYAKELQFEPRSALAARWIARSVLGVAFGLLSSFLCELCVGDRAVDKKTK